MTHNQVREKYLTFYKEKGRSHVEIPSAPLLPENDPSTLFTSSGMQPLVGYLLGEKHPMGKRIVNSQKCFRAQDIDEVGDNRHTTFFEMLGNWSLGDPARNASHSDAGGYFKKEQLSWFFEFLTKTLDLAPEKLYVTVFEGNESVPKDTESIHIWKEIFNEAGIKAEEGDFTKGIIGNSRIFTYSAKKNWWSRSGEPDNMPPREPGGPDSEVFFDFGTPHNPVFGEHCHPNCDCGRFMEIGNSVFMQYQKKADGTLQELSHKNVDFGGGLERLVAATNDNPDIFQTDLFSQLIQIIEVFSNKKYSQEENKSAMRIIADHLKAATFLIVDGVAPSNKTQGYVLRRLLRRAAVKMHQLNGGLTPIPGFKRICRTVLKTYENTPYFNVSRDAQVVDEIIENEMSKFSLSLDKGLKEFQKASDSQLHTLFAFNLYQTYGFPYEITKELFQQKNKQLDKEEFDAIFKKHQELSRTTASGMFRGGLQDQSDETMKLHTATHLLQQALRIVLGEHVRQKGSHITAERLRFDFTHPQKLTHEEIQKVEELINGKIHENLKVSVEILSLEKALQQGALTVPGAIYPEQVKVYSIENFSKEVCGGPHVDFTGTLGSFKIVKEEGIAQGVRRIYAHLTGSHVDTQQNHARQQP